MLRELFDGLVKAAEKGVRPQPTDVTVNGQHLVRGAGGDYKPVIYMEVDKAEHLTRAQVLDLTSLLAWANGCADGELHISRRGISHARSPRRTNLWTKQDIASKDWFDEYLPTPRLMSYLEFRSWVDSLGEGLEDHEGIVEELQMISATSGKTARVRMSGAVVSFLGESKNEVIGRVRRRYRAAIPFGDPAFTAEVTFLISCVVQNGEVAFSAEHQTLDKAHDAYLAWAEAKAREALPEGWILLVTP